MNLYENLLLSLMNLKKAFGQAAEMYFDELLHDITEGQADSIDIRPLNEVFPQAHITHMHQSRLVTGFVTGGTVTASDGIYEHEHMLNGDIDLQSITDVISCLRSLKEDLKKGVIIKEYDPRTEEIYLKFPIKQHQPNS